MIEGGGWVGVGDERTRVQAGEAVVWPPDVLHAAWTDGTQMRAIVVEFAAPLLALPAVLDGTTFKLVADSTPVARGEGSLAPRPVDTSHRGEDPEAEEGEPL